MATLVEMRDITRPYERAYGRKRQYTETVTDDTSGAVLVPVDADYVAVVVDPGTDALVQFTTGSYAAIEADTAIWVDWDEGTVTEKASSEVSGSVTALRLVSTGASTWEITA